MRTLVRLTVVVALALMAGCASLPTTAKPCGVTLPTFRNDAPLDAAHMNEIARALRCLDERR